MSIHEHVGCLHLHTTASDGTGTHPEVGRIAEAVGLDFVIATDHNIMVRGQEAYFGRTLLLVGEEVHDVRRRPQANHLLVFNMREEVAHLAKDPQALIDAIRGQGGLSFLAHPYEIAPPFTKEPDISWVSWEVGGYTGLEIWNYMSEFKANITSLPIALLYAYFPKLAIRGPFAEVLARWDSLMAMRRVAAIGGPDAHARTYRLGPLSRQVFSYDHCFRALRTHILTTEPMNGNLEHDRALIYRALGEGRSFVAYDGLADARGFRFVARREDIEVTMGDEISMGESGTVELEATSPLPCELRLIHRGRDITRSNGRRLSYRATEPGAYRLEAYRRYGFVQRGWVFTNQIYVKS